MTTSESACDCDVDLNVANRSRRLAGTALAVAAGHYAARRKHIASRRAHARQVVEHHEDPGRQCGGRGDSARPLRQRASAQFLNVEAPFRRRNDELAIKRRGKRHRSERGHNFGKQDGNALRRRSVANSSPACYGAGGWSDAGLRRPGQDVAPLTSCVSCASAAPRGRPRTACPVKPRSTSLRRPGALLPPLRADASNPLPGWRHSTTC